MKLGYNTVDLHTGTKEYTGLSKVVKADHTGMPVKDSSYLATDERGHIQASFLSGDNSKFNIAPQAKDLNHGSYLSIENGEKDALIKGNTIETEKIAFSSNQPGQRPDAFLVNDTIIMENGKQQEIHHSFANMQNIEQEGLNAELYEHSDMLDVLNPEDTLRDSMLLEEYANLMEKTDDELMNLQDEYQVDEYIYMTNYQELDNMWEIAGEKFEVESINASNEWDMAASNEVGIDEEVNADVELSVDME